MVLTRRRRDPEPDPEPRTELQSHLDGEPQPDDDKRRRLGLWVTIWVALAVLVAALAAENRTDVTYSSGPPDLSQPGPDPGATALTDPAQPSPSTSGTGSPATPHATQSPGGPARPGPRSGSAAGSGSPPLVGGATGTIGSVQTFAAINGYGCPASGNSGFSEVGRYTDGRVGWYTVGSGSWTGDGCSGAFDTIDMSGDNQDDPTEYAEFSFSPGPATRSCGIAVYVPTSANAQDVAGNPTYYQVRETEAGPVMTTFTIDQRSNHGRWVNGPTVAATQGGLVVRLVNRGLDYDNNGPTYAHHAVSQVRVVCHN